MKGLSVNFSIKTDTKALRALIDGSHTADIAAALYTEAEAIMRWSRDEWVPIVTGQLYDSGYVKDPDVRRNKVSVEIGYDAPYALVVHEAPPDWGQGMNKYLEWPMLLSQHGMLDRVGERLRQTLFARAAALGTRASWF